VIETRTNQERIDDIKARLNAIWWGVYGCSASDGPEGGKLISYITGAEAYALFIRAVLQEFDIGDVTPTNIDPRSTNGGLAKWIVEVQDHKARSLRPT